MELFNLIKTFIFLVSGVMLYPVLLFLAGLTLYLIWEAGRFLGEWASRSRLPKFDPGRDAPEDFTFPPAVRRYLARLKALGRDDEPATAYLMRQCIAERLATLEKYKLLIRLGPALGLMGTLIPMGSALAGVSNGELTVVSSELVVAFTTTVVGLVIGCGAFAIHLVRRRWIASDIRLIEYLTEAATR